MSGTKMGSWYEAYGEQIAEEERSKARGKVIVGLLTGEPEPEVTTGHGRGPLTGAA